MPVLHIEHEITELAVWLDAFKQFAPAREAAGVTRTEVYQPADDPNYVVINLSFENLDAATRCCVAGNRNLDCHRNLVGSTTSH